MNSMDTDFPFEININWKHTIIDTNKRNKRNNNSAINSLPAIVLYLMIIVATIE